jgi:hypothetical protein
MDRNRAPNRGVSAGGCTALPGVRSYCTEQCQTARTDAANPFLGRATSIYMTSTAMR